MSRTSRKAKTDSAEAPLTGRYMDNKDRCKMKRLLKFHGAGPALLLGFFVILSCGRTQKTLPHLDHDFLSGTAEGLYRIQDLTVILEDPGSSAGEKAGDSGWSAARPAESPPENTADLQDAALPDFQINQTGAAGKESLYADADRDHGSEALKNSLKDLLKIRTAKKGKKVKISSGMENISIDPAIPFLNEYELLDYEILRPQSAQQRIVKKLLGEIRDFKGFPDTEYYILPHFLGNYLILYKLAPPDKIPYDELPLAKRAGGLLAVPLAGYPAEYCRPVKFLDANLRETLKYRPLCKTARSKDPDRPTQYIRLRAHGKQVFQYLKKPGFFPRDFFEGRWLYYRTLVRSPDDRIDDIRHTPFKTASLAEFRPSIGKIDIIEANPSLEEDDKEYILFIPVQWTDYEIARDSENLNSSFSERLREDGYDINRPYLEIKFEDLVKNEFQYQEKGGKSLKAVVIAEDYISFTVEITGKGAEAYMMRYDFKRQTADPNVYPEKPWFYHDNRLFPMHSIERDEYEDPADHTRRDDDRPYRVVRFNPNVREIVWRFSKQTSKEEWIREAGREAAAIVNKALLQAGADPIRASLAHKQAGAAAGADGSVADLIRSGRARKQPPGRQIQIVLDEGEDKDTADIRYNLLNLILSEGEADNQFHLGHNIVDPVTGEVISAAANVWINLILKDYIFLVRRYIRFQVYPPAWKPPPPFSPEIFDFIRDNLQTENGQCTNGESFGVSPFMHEKIQALCGEVSDFIEARQKEGKPFHPKGPPLQDEEILASCAKKLARVKVLQSVVRSMLRSLGMEEITSGSADKAHFYTQSEMEALFGRSDFEMRTESHPGLPQYSSVMDKMFLEYPILAVPGKLDLTVLRFIYFDEAELKDGSVLKIPSGTDLNKTQKTVLQALEEAGLKEEDLKNHKVCSREDNPLFCQREDYGFTPLEVLSNSICQTHNLLASDRNRYDSRKARESINISYSINALFNQWAEYRDAVLAARDESVADYSFFANPDRIEKYKRIMEGFKDHPEIGPYYAIRRVVSDWFRRMIFVPVKHCIYKEKSPGGLIRYKAEALEIIEEKILVQHPENSDQESPLFISCESQIVQDQAGPEKTLVAETGFFAKDRRYFIRPNEKTDPVDEESAFQNGVNSVSNSFEILYDPQAAEEYYREYTAYITEGIDLNPYIDREAIKDPDTPKDIQFERASSYQSETMEGLQMFLFDNLRQFRLRPLKKYIERLNKESGFEINRSLPFFFSYQSLSLNELRDYADSIETHPGLHDEETPFLAQVYKDYKEQTESSGEELSFLNYIKEHPAVLDDNARYLLPHSDDGRNMPALLFRRFNQFAECLARQESGGEICEGAEDKKAFKRFVLKDYKKTPEPSSASRRLSD